MVKKGDLPFTARENEQFTRLCEKGWVDAKNH